MTDEQKAAFINSQVCCVSIRAQGMAADNLQRVSRQEYPVYGKNDFDLLLEEYTIGCNDVVKFLNEGA